MQLQQSAIFLWSLVAGCFFTHFVNCESVGAATKIFSGIQVLWNLQSKSLILHLKKFTTRKLCSLEGCNFTKYELFHRNFQGFWLQISPENFLKSIVFHFEKLYIDWRYTHHVSCSYFIEFSKKFFWEGCVEIKIIWTMIFVQTSVSIKALTWSIFPVLLNPTFVTFFS